MFVEFPVVSVPTETPAPSFDFLTATPRERLVELAKQLRNQPSWDHRMKWNYDTIYVVHACGSEGCAIGLIQVLWGKRSTDDIRILLGLSCPEFNELFCSGAGAFSPITPHHVARRIDYQIQKQDYEASIRYRPYYVG